MPALADHLVRLRLGWPAPGRLAVHPRGAFAFEQGAEVAARLREAFGDLSALSCADLGCGPVETVIARGLFALPFRELVSVEVHPPYLEKLRDKTPGAAEHRVIPARIEDALTAIGPQGVDLVALIDVLEHFERRDALRLLVRLEKVARRGIVLFSPVGDVPQEPYDGNELQRHRSTWRPGDWLRLGYDVQLYEAFHGHLDPPADAAWAIKRLTE